MNSISSLENSIKKLVLELNAFRNSNKELKHENKKLRAENGLLHKIIDKTPLMTYDKTEFFNEYYKLTKEH